jgi:hypothetical protein
VLIGCASTAFARRRWAPSPKISENGVPLPRRVLLDRGDDGHVAHT